jgi:hypothetical protein
VKWSVELTVGSVLKFAIKSICKEDIFAFYSKVISRTRSDLTRRRANISFGSVWGSEVMNGSIRFRRMNFSWTSSPTTSTSTIPVGIRIHPTRYQSGVRTSIKVESQCSHHLRIEYGFSVSAMKIKYRILLYPIFIFTLLSDRISY